jgi:DNA-binding GntR family transcriptional regulator
MWSSQTGGAGDSVLIAHSTKTDLAVERIRRAILQGRYPPGEKLRQNRLATELGLSPTPVREALRRLQAEGLVTHSPHRGVRVSHISIAEIKEIYRILEALEGLAARLVAERLDRASTIARLEQIQSRVESRLKRGSMSDWVRISNDFETTIHGACESPRLQQVLQNLWDAIPRDRIGVVESMAASTTAEHRAVLEAIRSGDPDVAEQTMRAHIRQSSAKRVAYLLEVAAPGVSWAPAASVAQHEPRTGRGNARRTAHAVASD